MKETLRLVGVLLLFCLASGLLLAWTNAVTRAPIEQALAAEKLQGLGRVLPRFDNDLLADAQSVTDGGREWVFYVGREKGAFIGAAFEAEASGYGGPIRLLVGVLPDGTLHAVQVLAADKETPGLGSKIKEAAFLGQFKGRSALERGWAAVRKDGGAIEAVTGATISSRAVVTAVKSGLEVYARHAAELRGAP